MKHLARTTLSAATTVLFVLWVGFALLEVTHLRIPLGRPLPPGTPPTYYRGWVDGSGVTLFPPGSIDSAILYPSWVLLVLTLTTWIAHRQIGPPRRKPGLCPTCNYDLRATPDRCPECGTIPA